MLVVGCGTSSAPDVCELAARSNAASVTIVNEKPIYLSTRMRNGAPFTKEAKLFHLLVPDVVSEKASTSPHEG